MADEGRGRVGQGNRGKAYSGGLKTIWYIGFEARMLALLVTRCDLAVAAHTCMEKTGVFASPKTAGTYFKKVTR